MFKGLRSTLSKHGTPVFLVVTLVVGLIVLWPLHDFQHYLSQGDHGRDLYASSKVLEGQLPYRDFSWQFGPLMPYYYGACYLIGGESIQSMLTGQMALILLAGVFVYLICASFLPAPMSFLCAFWYWSFRGTEFFYTYNHIGGLLAILVTIYTVFLYLRSPQRRYAVAGFVSAFALMMIRLNMGIAVLAALCASLVLADRIRRDPRRGDNFLFYFLCASTVLAVAGAIYAALLNGLPSYVVAQSFPYGKSQRTDFSPSVWYTVVFALKAFARYFTATWPQRIFGLLLLLSSIRCVALAFSSRTPEAERKNYQLMFGALLIFIFLCSHEYAASGVLYRFFWILPLLFILMYHLISTALKDIRSELIWALVFITLFLPAFWAIQFDIRATNTFKTPDHQLRIGQTKVYTLQDPRWYETVTATVAFLRKNTRPDEKIGVFPFDPLYCFLSGRDSAIRQLVFFEHIGITEEQERATIEELERAKTDWIIVSSRFKTPESGMGIFGKTHCRLIRNYIFDRFEPVATFGDWQGPSGWAWNHSTMVYRRKN